MKTTAARRCPCQGGTLTRFLQPSILALLLQGPDHGYGLLQKLSQSRLWHEDAPDAAGLYRTLHDMEERGLITSRLTPESQAGLGKRVFSLTDEGRRCSVSWLRTLSDYRRGLDDVIALLRDGTGETGV